MAHVPADKLKRRGFVDSFYPSRGSHFSAGGALAQNPLRAWGATSSLQTQVIVSARAPLFLYIVRLRAAQDAWGAVVGLCRSGSDYSLFIDECSCDEIPIFSIFGDMSRYLSRTASIVLAKTTRISVSFS